MEAGKVKTAEQVATEIVQEHGGDGAHAFQNIVRAIEADRAQREHPMSDPLIELREWCNSIRPYLYSDKGNDWSEELAQLDVIEERLDEA
jgi:hypothetical protein